MKDDVITLVKETINVLQEDIMNYEVFLKYIHLNIDNLHKLETRHKRKILHAYCSVADCENCRLLLLNNDENCINIDTAYPEEVDSAIDLIFDRDKKGNIEL